MGLGPPFGFDGDARACRTAHQFGGRMRGFEPEKYLSEEQPTQTGFAYMSLDQLRARRGIR